MIDGPSDAWLLRTPPEYDNPGPSGDWQALVYRTKWVPLRPGVEDPDEEVEIEVEVEVSEGEFGEAFLRVGRKRLPFTLTEAEQKETVDHFCTNWEPEEPDYERDDD